MSNTIMLRHVIRREPVHTKSFDPYRETLERRERLEANGMPVIRHDIDYPHAEVVGDTYGTFRYTPDQRRALQRILDLGGVLWTPIMWSHTLQRFESVNLWGRSCWRLPRKLDPQRVTEVLT